MSKVKCQGEAQRPWEQHGQRLQRETVPGSLRRGRKTKEWLGKTEGEQQEERRSERC